MFVAEINFLTCVALYETQGASELAGVCLFTPSKLAQAPPQVTANNATLKADCAVTFRFVGLKGITRVEIRTRDQNLEAELWNSMMGK